MNYRVVIETRAIRDIDEATGWIASKASDAAERWFNAIEAEINALSRFPERCPRAREDGSRGNASAEAVPRVDWVTRRRRCIAVSPG